MQCIWCNAEPIGIGLTNSYWNTPDGKSAVEILEIPAVDCPNCGTYVTESTAQQIEEALYWNDISALGAAFRYEELMNAPRISKSYFGR